MSDTITLTERPVRSSRDATLQSDPLIGYRDYLVDVWKSVTRIFSMPPEQPYQKLTNRFHQDFSTTDVAVAQANEVLIPIVKEILTAPKPTGFGLPATGIPTRSTDQSARDYLDALIGASGTTATEFGLRYRLDLTRSDAATSSPAQENVATLRGFLRDSFQATPDPFTMPPDNDTIVPTGLRDSAPFFLEYDEWVTRSSEGFYPENLFSMLRNLRADELADSARKVPNTDKWYQWFQKAAAVFDDVQKAVGWISTGEYTLALNLLDDTKRGADTLITQRVNAPIATDTYKVEPAMKARQALPVGSKQELLKLEQHDGGEFVGGGPVTFGMVLYAGYFHYLWRADVLLALDRFTEAASCLLGLQPSALGAAEQDTRPGWNGGSPNFLYSGGSLAYTWRQKWGGTNIEPWLSNGMPPLLHSLDQQFIRLRLGNVLLEWADTLFRADEASLNDRARELYKAVLRLHGVDPGISPIWDATPAPAPSPGNPAVVSQISRARVGFAKSDAGLNYFGFTNDMVPVQRYRTLKDEADQYAALALAAERDFLVAMAQLETLSIDSIRTSNMLVKARAQQSIANEQRQIADYNVAVAKQQVVEVQKQIDAKKAEIADHDSFFGQWSDFIGAVGKTATSFFNDTKDAPGGSVSDQIESGIKAELGFSDASSAGLLGLGTGASVLAGYGLFVYVGYSALSSMASAAKTRSNELNRLQQVTMPLAQANVTAREREVTIAQLQATVAAADFTLAQNLIAFNEQRLLNTEFWASVAAILQRVLRRYLDLGAWSAWLAERALAFEQNRSVRAASGGSWDTIVDVVIEIQGLARYAEALRQTRALTVAAKPAYRFVMMSARIFAKDALAALRKTGSGSITLDFRVFPFPIGEYNRMVSNVAILLPRAKGQPVNAHLRLDASTPTDIDFTIGDGTALSNGKPLRLPGSTTPVAPLNSAIGMPVDQAWSIQINASPGSDLSRVADLVVGIDYSANLPNLPTLAQGSAGPDVRWAQYLLVGHTMTYDQIDGKFGPVTKQAVMQFQRDHGLDDDSVIGPLTWLALDGERERPPKLERGAESDVVRKLQTALNQGRGKFVPTTNPALQVDGKFGAITEDAVRATQRFNHISDDGIVWMQTWAIPTRSAGQVLADLCGVPGPG